MTNIFKFGDTIVLYENTSKQSLLTLREGGQYQCQLGIFQHSQMLMAPGSKIYSNTGKYLYLLPNTPALLSLNIAHKTQIIYQMDIAQIILKLNILPNHKVIETGTGSGSLSQSILANIPKGFLYTYEFNKDRQQNAIALFQKLKYENVRVILRDTCGEGFQLEDEKDLLVDSVFLDVPRPWDALRFSVNVLKKGGRVCCFSPCIEQVQKNCNVLRELGFEQIETIESLVREFQRTECVEKIPQEEFDSEITTEQQENNEHNDNSQKDTQEDADEVGDKRKMNQNLNVNNKIKKRQYYTTGTAQQKGHTAYLTFGLYP